MIRKTNNKKSYFQNKIRIAHAQFWAQNKRTSIFLQNKLGQYVFNNTKALTKVTKRSSKEAKKPCYNYHLHRLKVTINDMNSFKHSRSFLMRVLHVTLSFNNTGFVQCPQQFYQVARRHPNSLNNKSIMAFWHKNTVYHDRKQKRTQLICFTSFWFLKCHRQTFKTEAYPFLHILNMDDLTTMFRALCFIRRQHKHLSCRPCCRHTL